MLLRKRIKIFFPSGGFKNMIKYLFAFVKGQLPLQIINLFTGFFLLRWLTLREQAIFAVAFSFQSLILSISDLGFTGSIIAMVGNKWNDKIIVGSYVAAAKKLRTYFFLVSLALSSILIPFIAKKQTWTLFQVLEIFTPVLLGVFWQANCSLYDSVLVMHKKLSELFRPQLIMSSLKLGVIYILYKTGYISALYVIILNALVYLSNGKTYKRNAQQFVFFDTSSNNNKQIIEIFNYIKPLLPSIIFNALNGQIQIFLISLFGKSINIAEVSALGKLSQLFLFLNSFNSLVIAPYIAKTEREELFKKYLIVFLSALITGGAILLFTYCFPFFLKSFLGKKFSYLSNDYIFLLVFSSTVGYWSVTLWTMSSVLKWVYWWASIANILIIISIEVLSIIFLNISTTIGVLEMGLFVNVAVFLLQISISIVGFYKIKLCTLSHSL